VSSKRCRTTYYHISKFSNIHNSWDLRKLFSDAGVNFCDGKKYKAS